MTKKFWIPLSLGTLALAPVAFGENADKLAAAAAEGPACLASDTRSFAERLRDSGYPPAQEQGDVIEGDFTPAGEASVLAVEENATAAANPSFVYTKDGEFLVGTYNNMNYHLEFFGGQGERSFKKLILDVDFHVGRFAGPVNDDPTDYGRLYYCLFWVQSGSAWDDAYGYFNFLDPGSYAELQSNTGGYWQPDIGQYGLKIGTGCGGVGEGGDYHAHWEYDAQNGVQWFRITTLGGSTVCEAAGDTGVRSIDTSRMFIELGSQYAPEGPEGATIGWRFSNLKIQLIGDTPTGRRPRRR